MPEYIIEIEEDQSDESEVFIGWIRRHSKQLIRCKYCENSKPWYGNRRLCFLWNEEGASVFEDGFCNYAIEREEE